MSEENRSEEIKSGLYAGKRVLIYGAGRSGRGAFELLKAVGARPLVYDENAASSPEDIQAGFESSDPVEAICGELPDSVISECDIAVLSPGVPVEAANVQRIKEAGVPVIGEVELAFTAGKGRVLAVTGTNGKTTTTALLGEILRAYFDDVHVVGNIGNAYTGEALSMRDDSVIAAEISSFQLETIDTFHPEVSAILNITEDHLNRHHTMEEYARVKERVAENQTKNEVCVLNYEDEVLRAYADTCPADVFFFSSEREIENGIFLDGSSIVMSRGGKRRILIDTEDLKLLGTHNYENVMAAAAMAYSAGVPEDVIRRVCADFSPVAHRIEFVGEKRGVTWYNDSKGTNPDAAIRGIRAMRRPTWLIAGGYDKGSDYGEWIRSFDGKVKMLVLEGATRYDIRDSALANGFPEDKIRICENMSEAMDYCRDNAEEGDAVLLSPACASWGEFPNYEVRGDTFRKYVEEEIP